MPHRHQHMSDATYAPGPRPGPSVPVAQRALYLTRKLWGCAGLRAALLFDSRAGELRRFLMMQHRCLFFLLFDASLTASERDQAVGDLAVRVSPLAGGGGGGGGGRLGSTSGAGCASRSTPTRPGGCRASSSWRGMRLSGNRSICRRRCRGSSGRCCRWRCVGQQSVAPTGADCSDISVAVPDSAA